MNVKTAVSASVIAFILFLSGCDSYSLFDRFERIGRSGDGKTVRTTQSGGADTSGEPETPGETETPDGTGALKLALDKALLSQGETTELKPRGGKPPYSFAVSAEALHYTGTPGSISGTTYTAGDSVGRMRISATDAEGAAAYAHVDICPPAPTAFALIPGSKSIRLTWAYSNTMMITGFRIIQATDGVTFSDTDAVIDNIVTTHTFEHLNKNKAYTYRLSALAGTLESTYLEASGSPLP